MNVSRDELVRGWMEAVGRREVRSRLEGVYALASAEIAARGPSCWASGRCCNFDRAGHRLYVTGLEAAYVVAGLSVRGAQQDGGVVGDDPDGARLSLPVIDTARRAGGCPFQERNLCGVHTIKPLGCRVYFCDRSAQDWQQDLSERLLNEVRALHDEWVIEYRYSEWREMLARFAATAGGA